MTHERGFNSRGLPVINTLILWPGRKKRPKLITTFTTRSYDSAVFSYEIGFPGFFYFLLRSVGRASLLRRTRDRTEATPTSSAKQIKEEESKRLHILDFEPRPVLLRRLHTIKGGGAKKGCSPGWVGGWDAEQSRKFLGFLCRIDFSSPRGQLAKDALALKCHYRRNT